MTRPDSTLQGLSLDSVPPSVRRAGRIALVVALAVLSVLHVLNPGRGGFLDALNLSIHETGHLVFAFFGVTLAALGGTLFQLIVPLTFAAVFWRRGERFAACVPAWWAAQNLFGISVYVADARAQVLPLVGGGQHDWAFLLGRWGLLQHDRALANAIHFAGLLAVLACLWGALVWLNQGLVDRPAD